jgi:general secretion pathway protein L
MTTLIVTLPSESPDASVLYDCVSTPDGFGIGEHSRVPLALIAAGAEIVAMVPSLKLSWFAVQLPKGALGRRFFQESGSLRLRAVLEGLLEDRLLDETSQLHFAIQPDPQDDLPVWVAVCDRVWLHTALQTLEKAGLPVSRIVPEFAPDALPDMLCVTGEPGHAQFVFTSRGGVAIWPASLSSAALLNWPEAAQVVAEPAVAAWAEQLLHRNVSLQQISHRRVQALQSSWDLAQFDLVNSSGARTGRRLSGAVANVVRAPRWRAARVAVLALFVVNLAGLNAWAWKEQAAVNARRGAIRDVLTQTFPNVRVVVDAPVQMAREVAALQQASGAPSGRDLEAMLNAFATVAPALTTINAIEFVSNELRLKGLKLTPEVLSAIPFKLKPLGYSATVEGDSLMVKQVSGL